MNPPKHHDATTEMQHLDYLRAVLAEGAPTARMRAAAADLADTFADILAAPYAVQALCLEEVTRALRRITSMEGTTHDDDN
ncbi:MAG: hypothetical protein ACTIL2_14065 [Corynebacterium sp.]|uniref:hypothetical protein n=1 Tax=unclassified Corynebacterium TaxID=2624378 RepID=UPI003F9A072D